VTGQLVSDSSAFPAEPPSDLDDPRTLISNDWASFSSISHMANHWDRPAWEPSHRAYYWMLTFTSASDLIAEARTCQRELAQLDLDEVPEDGLHITMCRIGNRAEVASGSVDTLAQMASGRTGPSFDLLAHPMAGSRGAVRFTISPWTPLIRLHAVLTSIGRRVGVPGGKPTSSFRPHLGVAYNNRIRPARPVIDAVAALRTRRPVAIGVDNVDLVELRREGRAYRWETQHRIPLSAI
jgi:hypothetical protein